MKAEKTLIQQLLNSQNAISDSELAPSKIEYLTFIKQESTRLNPTFFFTPNVIQSRQHEYPYFFREKLDKPLREALHNSGHIILSGKRNAGKSRMVFEALQHLETPRTVFISNISDSQINGSFSNTNFSLAILKKHVKKHPSELFCLYLQGVDALGQFGELYHFIEDLSGLDNLSIIICRTDRGLQRRPHLIEVLPNDPALNFLHIPIPNLTKDQLDAVKEAHLTATEQNLETNRNFDRTIGTLIQRIDQSNEEYLKFEFNSLERKLLWSFKSINFLTGADYCSRQNLVAFTAASTKLPVDDTSSKLEKALDHLLDKGLVFQSRTGQDLYLPPAYLPFIAKGYLFHIFGSNNISRATKRNEEQQYLIEDILERFHSSPTADKLIIGNRLLQCIASSPFPVVKHLFNRLSKEIAISLDSFHALIANSKDLKIAEYWDNCRTEAGISATIDTLLSFEYVLPNLSGFSEKATALQLDHVDDSLVLLHAYLRRIRSLQEAEEILSRFKPGTIGALPPYYFTELINRLSSFQQGHQVYKLLRDLKVDVSAHFYYSLILLNGGAFTDAFTLFEELQDKDIEMTDSTVLKALVFKTTQLSEVEQIITELNRLPHEKRSDSVYEAIVASYKEVLGDHETLSRLVKKTDNLHSQHQLLLLGDLDEKEREVIIQQLINDKLAKVKSFEYYLDHDSISFSQSMTWYNRMIGKEINLVPSFDLIEILLGKYLNEPKAKQMHAESLALLYRDIEEILSVNAGPEFAPVFVQLKDIITDLNQKIELFEFAIEAQIDVSPFVSDLCKDGKTYLDALSILDIIYAAGITPEINTCHLLLNVFLPKALKEEDRHNVVLFFKDLKNCQVNDAVLSKLYLSIVNSKKSGLKPADYLEDLKAIGIKDVTEVLVEIVFSILDPKNIFQARTTEIIDEIFPKEDIELSAGIIEALVFRSSNFQIANALYTATKERSSEITQETYKKLLDYALHSRAPELVLDVLQEVREDNVDYLVPLLSKLEKRPQYQSMVHSFISSAEIETNEFQRGENRRYWTSKLKAAEEELKGAKFLSDDLLQNLDEVPFLEDAIEAASNLLVKSKLDANFLIELIGKLLEKAAPQQVPLIIDFYRQQKLEYLSLDPNVISEFILHAGDEQISRALFEEFQRKYKRYRKNGDLYYQSLVHPFYCLLSVATSFEYPFAIFQDLAKIYPSINPIVVERLAQLMKGPEDAKHYLKLMAEYDIQLSDGLLNLLLNAYPLDEAWDLLDKFKVDIRKINHPIYNGLLDLREKESKDWNDFQGLFEVDNKLDKHWLLTRFVIQSCDPIDSELFELLLKPRVKFPLFMQLWALFEKEKKEFPFEYVDKKVHSFTNKQGKKISKSARMKKYRALLAVADSTKSMEKLIFKILQGDKVKIDSLLSEVVIEAPTLGLKMKLLKAFGLYHQSSSKSPMLGKDALIGIFDCIHTKHDWKWIKYEFSQLEGKIRFSENVNMLLIDKRHNLQDD